MSVFFIFPQEADQAREDAFAAGDPSRVDAEQQPNWWEVDPSVLPRAYTRGVLSGLSTVLGVGERLANLPNTALETPSYLLPQGEAQRAGARRVTDPRSDDRTALSRWFAEHRQEARDLVASSPRPDPRTVSEATNIIAGVVEAMAPASFGGGVVGSSAGFSAGQYEHTYQDLRGGGASDEVAQTGALQDAFFASGMAAAPVALPGRLLTRAASGAAINLAFGSAMRGNMHNYLTEQGYGEGSDNNLAQNYQWLDNQAMAIDAILGASFGMCFGKAR